ncbi:hypothetical protein N7539_006632 [Penicillium diatomitis]|uniref:Uncharacterized protein n=1 Tax=Penicillium diatomitis TaxID=2819901 RepID=A0A9W9X1J0_9EURO|nr:uncharacterized protein N7539_006632 [Penicillium diatomitis]KAJ5480738.1 hypothetical protein N7539_006632 [Penicillium diatomitis]
MSISGMVGEDGISEEPLTTPVAPTLSSFWGTEEVWKTGTDEMEHGQVIKVRFGDQRRRSQRATLLEQIWRRWASEIGVGSTEVLNYLGTS